MKVLLILFLTFYSCIHASNSEMKEAKKEAEKMAKNSTAILKENLKGKGTLGFSDQDLLPDVDKGHEFDVAAAEKQYKHPSSEQKTNELQMFLATTKKREQLEENEQFLVEGHSIIQKPHASADITSLNTQINPEESLIETCQESGSYQVAFSQTLTVNATPDIKQSIRHCTGHRTEKYYSSKADAKSKIRKKKEEFQKWPDLICYDVWREGHYLISTWTHKDNEGSCDSFFHEEKVIHQGKEEDFWTTDNPNALSIVESNPSCKLLYTKFPEGAETRVINGKPVSRDAWLRQLYFSCEPSSDSKCAKLRAQGGVLTRKKCLIENDLGECELWEKTYDLGKIGSFQKTTVAFKNTEIWGLENEFESSYEKNTDFGSTLTEGSEVHEKLKIFNGEALKCQKSFVAGALYDCCKGMDGVAVAAKLAGCSTEEKCLGENRKLGKCHFIGSQKVKLGTVTEHVFCCFPTKLARVIHEEGRKQLKIKWGSAEKPKCRGFTLEELQRIDFSKIDLSEVVDDIKIDKASYGKKLVGSVDALKSKVQRDIEQQRQESIAEVDPTI